MGFIARLFRKRRDSEQKQKRSTWSSPKRWFSSNSNSVGGYRSDDQDTVFYDEIDHDLLFHCIQAALCPNDASVTAASTIPVVKSPASYQVAKTTDRFPSTVPTTPHLTDKARKRWSTGMLDDFSPPTKGFRVLTTIPEIATDTHLFSNTPSPPPPIPSPGPNKEIRIYM